MAFADRHVRLGNPRWLNRHPHCSRLFQQGLEGGRVWPARRCLAYPDRCRSRTGLCHSLPTPDDARKQEIPTIRGAEHAQDVIARLLRDDHELRSERGQGAYGFRLERAALPKQKCINRRSACRATNQGRANEDFHDLL